MEGGREGGREERPPEPIRTSIELTGNFYLNLS